MISVHKTHPPGFTVAALLRANCRGYANEQPLAGGRRRQGCQPLVRGRGPRCAFAPVSVVCSSLSCSPSFLMQSSNRQITEWHRYKPSVSIKRRHVLISSAAGHGTVVRRTSLVSTVRAGYRCWLIQYDDCRTNFTHKKPTFRLDNEGGEVDNEIQSSV